jgi:hypothetical protein
MASTEGPSLTPNTLLPLASPVIATLQTLARTVPGAELRPSPFCHEDAHEVRGWVLDLPCDAPGHMLPLPHNLFHGLALARCEIPEAEALGYLQNADATRAKLADAVRAIRAPAEPVTWARCRPTTVPESLYCASRDREGRITFEPPESQPALLEHATWAPELSPDGFVGLFFEWCAESQRLQLYVACQSYLPQACAEFSEMAYRAGKRCAVAYLCMSDEAQWLRAACARNRARIIARVSSRMGLRVPLVGDYCGAGKEDMALVHAETLHHDLCMMGDNSKVRLMSYCAPETRAGSLCVMAPWEGIWLFKGARNGGNRWLFPTTTPRVRERARPWTFTTQPRKCRVVIGDVCDDNDDNDERTETKKKKKKKKQQASASADLAVSDDDLIREAFKRALVTGDTVAKALAPSSTPSHASSVAGGSYHLVFDESVLQHMTGLGWSRALGMAKLMPLGIVPWRAVPVSAPA